ncbi:MAG TPA: YfhO family protein [Chloroflexia bacterium]|nr:YfhO family protein [Chloroflexia bacterium]
MELKNNSLEALPLSEVESNLQASKSSNWLHKIGNRLKNETVQGILILLGLLLLFFSTPLLNIFTGTYSAADLTQSFSISRTLATPANYIVKNPLLSDTVVSYNPFYTYNRISLWSGHLPLWNPYNGGGVPHIANYQSAFFSIFTIPFYFMPFKFGLLVTAFMKLFGIGFFMYLFLKQLRLHQIAALVGATAFMFSAFNIVWLQYTVTPVVVTLPACLFFSEYIFQQKERGVSQPKNFWALVGLSLSLTSGLLSAHPETFFYTLLMVVAYIGFRLLNLAHRGRYSKFVLLDLSKLAAQMIVAGLIGLALASIQIVPFFEYLQNSLAVNERVDQAINKQTLLIDRLPLLFFPDALGNYTTPLRVVGFNYNEENGRYIGSLVLLLALLSVRYISRDKYVRYFNFVAVAWLFYAYNLLGTHDFINSLPGMQFGNVRRSYPVWLLGTSCSAALFVHHLLNRGTSKKIFKVSKLVPATIAAGVIGILGLVFLVAGILLTQQMVTTYYNLLKPYQTGFLSYIPSHIWFLGLTFGVGLLLLISLAMLRHARLRTCLGLGLVVVVFSQSGWLLKDYNPTISDKYFYPNTPALGNLRQIVGSHTVMFVGWNGLPADMNSLYQFSTVQSYDSLWINQYEQLAREMFSESSKTPALNVYRSSEAGFKLFGVEYFIPLEKPFSLEAGLLEAQYAATQSAISPEILPGNSLVQEFKPNTPDLRQVTFKLHTFNRTNNCTLSLSLEEVTSNQKKAEKTLNCADIKNDASFSFAFSPLPDSKNKSYYLIVSSPDAVTGQAISAWTKPTLSYPDGKLSQGNTLMPGGLDFNYFTGNQNDFSIAGDVDYRVAYRIDNSLGRYYTVSNFEVLADDAKVREVLDRPGYDPYQQVILNRLPEGGSTVNSSEPARAAEVVSEKPEEIELKVTRQTPGFLVLTKPYYPGWKVEVNGMEKPLLRANSAFSAVKLEPGESQIRFYYDPFSFKLGGAITALAGLTGLVLIIWNLRVKRKKNQFAKHSD